MNTLCRDCLYAYRDLYSDGIICSKCQNGSKFTPSVIGTELVLRGSWTTDPKIQRQVRLITEDCLNILYLIEEMTEIPLSVKHSDLFHDLMIIKDYCDKC